MHILQDQSANPCFRVHAQGCGAHCLIDDQDLINFASHDYLGLSAHPQVKAASTAAVERYGTSVSASRLVAGERPFHHDLEQALADFLGTEDALVMVSGYLTNLTLISYLMESGDLVVYDSQAHDSVVRGARSGNAAQQIFPHNDLSFLEARLKGVRQAYRRVMVVVQGVCDVDGDYPDLPALVELRDRYHFWLLVDESHSLGTLGRTGRGLAEHYGVGRERVDLWTGSLSRTLASCGGYVAGRRLLIDYLKYTVPGFVFSVGIPPSWAAAAQAALEILRREPHRVLGLQSRSHYFLEQIRACGLDPGLSQGTPLVPVVVGDSATALDLACMLGERGVSTSPMAARLRFFLTCQHSCEDLRQTARLAADCLAQLSLRKPTRSLRSA